MADVPTILAGVTLTWSPVRDPSTEVPYTHTEARTPFGRVLLTWKSWKDDLAVTIDECPWGGWSGCYDSIEDAKRGAEEQWRARIAEALGVAAGPRQEVHEGNAPGHYDENGKWVVNPEWQG